ncbi:DUF2179 domain-containing protein [Candidatus Latescibacterota bacterium]
MPENIFAFVILPLLIFLSRVIDVSLGTMRMIFVSRGFKLYAVLCGFFEILIWLFAITQIMNNLTNPFYYIVYASGFASGNFIGMLIEERIALGNVLLRVVTQREPLELVNYLKNENYGVTILPAQGLQGTVTILFSVIPRCELPEIVKFIKSVNPKAFFTVEDVRFVSQKNAGYDSSIKRLKRKNVLSLFPRKGK